MFYGLDGRCKDMYNRDFETSANPTIFAQKRRSIMVEFQERKSQLLEAVHAISDETALAEWEEVYRKIRESRERIQHYRATLREKFDPEVVRRSRGYRKPNKAKVMQLIKQMDIQEPIELLLSQLTK